MTGHVLPPDEDVDQAIAVFKVLSDRTRLLILLLLADQELSVTEIAERLGRSMPAISQHLARLKAHKLISWRREGTSIFYSQPDEHVHALVTNVCQHAEHMLYAIPPHHRIGDEGKH